MSCKSLFSHIIILSAEFEAVVVAVVVVDVVVNEALFLPRRGLNVVVSVSEPLCVIFGDLEKGNATCNSSKYTFLCIDGKDRILHEKTADCDCECPNKQVPRSPTHLGVLWLHPSPGVVVGAGPPGDSAAHGVEDLPALVAAQRVPQVVLGVHSEEAMNAHSELGKRVVPRLRESHFLTPSGRGVQVHAT